MRKLIKGFVAAAQDEVCLFAAMVLNIPIAGFFGKLGILWGTYEAESRLGRLIGRVARVAIMSM